MKDINIKKVALAYFGGLDTSIIIPWLKETYNCEIIAVVGNVGQDSELEGLMKKALNSGASKIFIENIEDEYIDEYVFPTLKAGAKYEERYLLGTATARPVIAKRLVEIAKRENCDAISHGSTGKGNDQVRFEMAIKHFAPDMKIIAPWRIWDIKSREEEFSYAEERNIPLKISKETNYSKDLNVWHLSHEGLELENPSNEPNYEKMLEITVTPEKAPDKSTYLTVSYEKGIPVALNGVKMKGSQIVRKLNKIGGENGIGIADIVENRLVGIKTRGVYETPGGTILYHTHKALETLTLDGDTLHYKEQVAVKFAELVYNGKWFTPLREALSAFVEETQKFVTGDVTVRLYKGNIIGAGMTSPYSLYSEEYATFGEDEVYDQYDATGFINIFSLPTVVNSKMKEKIQGEKK